MYRRIIRNTSHNKKRGSYVANIQKEFDDAISAYRDDQPKLTEILFKLFRITCDNMDGEAEKSRIHVGKTILLCTDGTIRHRYMDGFWLVISSYASRVLHLLTKVTPESAVLIAITYYNMRSHSGTNWSPQESYPDLFDAKYKDYTKFECYASIFNNQNYLSGTNVVDHIFTKNACDLVYPGVMGSWPADVWPMLTGDRQMLLVNPVYSEAIITDACDNVYRMWLTYPTLVFRMTLPVWNDMYGEIFARFREMGCIITLHKKTTMRNYDFNATMSLNIYTISCN